ncbi:MAG: SIMPL domain-containing protein [Pseudodonghicola sp.]
MTQRVFATAAILAALLGAPAWAGDTTPRQISVTGEGVVEAAPDMATITLGVTHEAAEAQQAMRATSEAVGKMLERLAGMGIASRDLQTRELSLSPVWSEIKDDSEGRQQITGFVASNTVLVRVRDLNALGGILDAVIAEGGNDFSGLRFAVQEPAPLQDAARKAAVADAMARAKLLAEAAGVTLGPVLTMQDQGGGMPMPMAEMSMRMGAAKMPVAAGEISVTANVSMVFSIAE